MFGKRYESFIYCVIFFSLSYIDYILGNGFIDISQRLFCKLVCFIKRTVKEEAKNVYVIKESPVSVNILVSEIVVLILTIVFLKKLRGSYSRDRLDELLQESKDALRQTNEFLEKWRLRRLPKEFSYLDEEPQEIKPLQLKVPILHMAIIDTLGTARNQLERGDTGDTDCIIDSTVLSFSSLLDDEELDFEDKIGDHQNKEEVQEVEFKERRLWDVLEEDGNTDD